MELSGRFEKKLAALLSVLVNGESLCSIRVDELPCEKTPSIRVPANSVVSFADSSGTTHTHALGVAQGWVHLSIRVHANRACQADCVISDSETFDPNALMQGKATGIRFQPFFLEGAFVSNHDLAGKGLFARGLHFSGNITPGNILLSCECDKCHRSFLIRSYHAGFSNAGYFYSGSGKHTLTVNTHVAGSPAPLSAPDPEALTALEQALPKAPDGTTYSYLNPFRCPHCGEPYINFRDNPGLREGEYYGNYFFGSELLQYEPAEA